MGDVTFSIDVQIASLKREIAMRKNVYPKWVTAGKMRAGEAEHEIGARAGASSLNRWLSGRPSALSLDESSVGTARPTGGKSATEAGVSLDRVAGEHAGGGGKSWRAGVRRRGRRGGRRPGR